MLLVVERREDPFLPPPADAAPRSTERALRHMGWPFPVNDYTVPLPSLRRAATTRPTTVAVPEPRRAPSPMTMQEPALALEVA